MKNVLLIGGIILLNFGAYSQEKLTLDQAIAIALEKNYDIQIAENNLEIADNNQDIKNSGFLPTVAVSAGGNYSNNNAFVETQDGIEKSINGIETTTYNASVGVNYVLYNGMNRKNNFDKLKKAYELANVQKQIGIDNTILEVYNYYYEIAKYTNNLNILKESFEISKNRLERINYQLEFGQKTSLDVLNAQVDVNNDSLNLINGQLAIDNAKRTLNYLLGFPVDQDFIVDDEVEINGLLNLEQISTNMIDNNNSAKQFELNKEIANYDLKMSKSGWMPTVSTNVSYGLNNGNYGPTSLFARQNVSGLNTGLSLTWNVFDGGSTSTKVANAKIAMDNQEMYKNQLDLNLKKELANTWSNYMNQLAVINFEETNVEISNQNFLKTLEKYNLGQVNSTDFRQAQLNLINAKVNLSSARFEVKMLEVQLKRLEGTLVNL